MTDFDRALDVIIAEEGGYTDDASDPGGPTRYGITEGVARAHGYHGDMREWRIEQARNIYYADYWGACKCDEIPWPLSLYVFDCAVNQGPDVARRLLQKSLNTVQDGLLGPVSMRLAKASTPWHAARFMALRALRYVGTRNFDRFGAGWMARLFSVAAQGTAK